jgi:hypothetical protein
LYVKVCLMSMREFANKLAAGLNLIGGVAYLHVRSAKILYSTTAFPASPRSGHCRSLRRCQLTERTVAMDSCVLSGSENSMPSEIREFIALMFLIIPSVTISTLIMLKDR